jgi:hypothetical protein
VSDEFTVPLCRGHHREAHRSGDEAGWWSKSGIDPTAAARVLWLKSHPLPSALINEAPQIDHGRQPRQRDPNSETNPIEKAAISQ